jgi:D-alanyl-D-alanine carboxypeptidase (penicillin-binding protein 5/6)
LIPLPPHRLMRASRAMTRFRTIVFAAAVLASALGGAARVHAQTFETLAPHALLMDFDSGTVLFEKAADEPVPPASMAKLMTAEYVFHELAAGRLSLDDTFVISENAWRTGGAPAGGSAMYAELGSSVALRDLLRGMIVQSGNDAAIAIAEGVAGSEAAFADRLNERAAELGLTGSTFRNASGLNDPEQLVTARDLGRVARVIIRDYPEFYAIFSEPEFDWNDILQKNRNPLLDDGIGVDGLKTGFIKESGYGITVSALRDTQRLILVIAGLGSEADREAEAKKLLDWGFRSFQQVTAFEAGETVAEASVYGGMQGSVPLVAHGPIRILVPRTGGDSELRARVVYDGPLLAPVEEGISAGAFRVWNGDRLIQETPLFTAEAVGRGPIHARALDALGELLFGWL